MKKTVVILLIAAMLCAMAAGCSSSDPVGSYYTKTLNGKTPIDHLKTTDEAAALQMLLGLMGLTEKEFNEKVLTIDLKSNGTVSLSSILGDSGTGTWKQEGSKIILTIDGETQEFTLKGNQLIGKFDQADIVLVKR